MSYMIHTPCYIVDESRLIHNLEILKEVKEKTGAKILLAQKAFSMYHCYELISNYLDGTTASGLYELKLGYEYFKKENHVFAAAYRDDEIDEIILMSDHIVFNSISQYKRYKNKLINKSVGIRVNPLCSTQGGGIYDPCSTGSRLGVVYDEMNKSIFDEIDGIHFHTLCEQNSDDLKKTIEKIEELYSSDLAKLKWINFGGGHHITKNDYDIETLCSEIKRIKEKYNVEVYLEPGEAVALDAGYLITSILDITKNGTTTNVIVDTSAACHMPDVLEMPYTPRIIGAYKENEKEFNYQIGGPTCLAGDIIGNYSFDSELSINDQLIFEDMAIYSMVKNNTFNGIRLPNIYYYCNNELTLVKEFGYSDFKDRL